jgi:predicted  nucleic acid-binding Zn-ribbon protein
MLPSEGNDDNGIVRGLKMEVQALKSRCDEQERTIKDLQSRYETHENVLEMLRREIVGLHDSQKTINTVYHGRNYDLVP